MPGFTTHYVLGMKAYNDMPQNNLKFIIAKYRWLYQLGLQGPDMFFYNLPILQFFFFKPCLSCATVTTAMWVPICTNTM